MAACVYGVLHDLITAHVSIEYFTVAHPLIAPHFAESPTALALVWGVVATWWVGLILGIVLAIAATFGTRPPMPLHLIAPKLVRLLITVGGVAITCGAVAYGIAGANGYPAPYPLSELIPLERAARFWFAATSHLVSYLLAFALGCRLIVQTWLERSGSISR